MARTSNYEILIKPHIDEIRNAVEAGATDAEIAKAFKISLSALQKYKSENPELKEAFVRGRTRVIFDIKAALLKKAIGFNYEESKTINGFDKNGNKITSTETYKKYSPPSETAAAMLLRNYDEKWRDNDKAASEIKKQETQLKKAIAESNNIDLKV